MAEGFDEKSESIFLLKRHQAFQRLFFFSPWSSEESIWDHFQLLLFSVWQGTHGLIGQISGH